MSDQALIAQNTQFVGINGEVVQIKRLLIFPLKQTGLGFAKRDQDAKVEEDQGIIDFEVIHNDRTHERMKLLIDLKNIFARQLPKMPKEYIVKLVFDRNHESMVILKDKSKVIAGICYRKYPPQGFAEIAFLAVVSNEQVRGYGTRLMNKYKEQMQKDNIEYLLTYADNYAIGYFKKQGFSKECRMPQERWKGFIKDYDGGTMMECYIHPTIDYNAISDLIKSQKQQLIELTRKLCLNDRVYPGLEPERFSGQRRQGAEDQEKPLVKPELIAHLFEAGWTIDDYHELRKQKERTFMIACQQIIDSMRKHKSSWPFLEAVNKDDVPDYYDIITDPIDIRSIEKKLQSNLYQTKESFVRDIKKIFTNAKTYNQPDTIYFRCACELDKYISQQINTLRDEIIVDGSKRVVGVSKKIKKK